MIDSTNTAKVTHKLHKGGGNRGKRLKGAPAEALIIQYALESPLKPQELTPKIERALELQGYPIPAPDTIIKRIRAARDSASHLDDPWSLKIYSKPIYDSKQPFLSSPGEAINDLVNIWKNCLAMDHIFTIRESQWVMRIRHAFPEIPYNRKRRGLLFGFAYRYSIRERIAEISLVDMETRDLDAALGRKIESTLSYSWDEVVFRSLRSIPRGSMFLRSQFEEPSKPVVPFHQFAAFVSPTFDVIEYHRPTRMFADTSFEDIYKDPPGGARYDFEWLADQLSELQDRMFAALLLYLSKGPTWNDLSLDDFLGILNYLLDLVTKELVTQSEPGYGTMQFEILDFLSISEDRPNGLTPEDVLSPKVLNMVGYHVESHLDTIDTPILLNEKQPRFKAVFKGVFK